MSKEKKFKRFYELEEDYKPSVKKVPYKREKINFIEFLKEQNNEEIEDRPGS